MKGIQTKGAREKGKGQIDLYLGAGAGQNTCGRTGAKSEVARLELLHRSGHSTEKRT